MVEHADAGIGQILTALERRRLAKNTLVIFTNDKTATILSATQTPVPADYRLDGVDLIPLLRDPALTTTRRIFWRRVPQERKQFAVRDADCKLLDDEGRILLFNVRTDPGERDDLAARYPDIVRKLAHFHEAWRKEVGVSPPSPEK
jgi:arylsulfatase A-like enzyme